MAFMNALKALFRPENSLNGDAFRFTTGLSQSNTLVNQKTAMQLSAVYACVNVLASNMAQLPLHVYERGENNSLIKAVEHPLFNKLHNAPNEEMTSFNFIETMMVSLLLWGNAYAQIVRNGKNEIYSLNLLMPNKMQVDRDKKSKKIIYKYQIDDGDSFSSRIEQRIFQKYEILHIAGLGFDGIQGLSPIGMAKNTLGAGLACDEYTARFFANDATPSGVFEHPGTLGKNTAAKLRRQWNKKHQGPKNAGNIAILEEGMKFSSISVPMKDVQFIENKRFTVEDIARIFNVPLHMIKDLEHATFSNIEHQSIEFVKYTLNPWVSRWEQALTYSLLTPEEQKKYTIRFNVDGLLRGDYANRMQGYATAVQNGIMSPNDIRTLENMELIPDEKGGNKYMVNGSMTPLEDAGVAYQKGGSSEA